MNFFCIAFFITALQINISWWINYLIKLAGLLFFVGGVFEISGVNSNYKRFSRPAVILAGVSFVATTCFVLFSLADISADVINITGIIFGVIITVASLAFQKLLLRDISSDSELVSDSSSVVRFKKSWDKLAVITLFNLLCDIVNRLAPAKMVADISGLLMAISKIIMYVFALIILYQANRIRADYNKKHSL